MPGGKQLCSFCCCCRPISCICCKCNLCVYCCRCPPPCLPPMEPMPCMPCMGPSPPPVRIIREQVLVPYPVPMCSPQVCSPCPGMTGHGFCPPMMGCPIPMCPPYPCPMPCPPPCPPPMESCCMPMPRSQGSCRPMCGGLGDLYGAPKVLPSECCYEVDPEVELFNPCPPAFPKRLYRPGCPIIPGYRGHVPGLRTHGAGRTFGKATKDTKCIMSQWGKRCPRLPRRIYEQ